MTVYEFLKKMGKDEEYTFVENTRHCGACCSSLSYLGKCSVHSIDIKYEDVEHLQPIMERTATRVDLERKVIYCE